MVIVARSLDTFGDDLSSGTVRATGIFLPPYVLLIIVPIVGIVAQFGLAEIPSPWTRDRPFAHSVTEIHEIAANALAVAAIFHAAAAADPSSCIRRQHTHSHASPPNGPVSAITWRLIRP